MKAEELKQVFLQSYTPGNYTDEEFGEMANEFEKDLDELLDEVSRESNKKEAILFLAFFMKETFANLFDDNRDWEIFSIKWYKKWLKEQEEQQ